MISRIQLIAWMLGIPFAALLLIRDVLTFQRSHGVSINGSAIWGRDFVNVWSSGRLMIEGKLALIYETKAYQAWQTAQFGWGINDHNYSYPPLTLLYTPLFGIFPYFWSLAIWTMGSLALFAWAAKPWLMRANLPAYLGAVIPTTIVCIWAGHYGLILGALWLGAWHLQDRRPALSGIMVGLMVVKPHMAVLMPLMLLRRRAWTTIGAAAATVAALVVLSVAVFGFSVWETYLTSTSQSQVSLITATRTFFIKMMPTLAPALFSYGFPSNVVWAAQAILAVMVAAALWRYQPEDRYMAGLAAAIGTFLVLPYAFNYDMTVVGLAALLLMVEWGRLGRFWHTLLAGVVFVLPAVLIFLNRNGLWVAPLALTLLLFLILQPAPENPTLKDRPA